MQSNQLIIEKETSDNIVEREVEPTKLRRNKKTVVLFKVWFEENKHRFDENIENQDTSLDTELEFISKTQETVDQPDNKQSS